MLPKSQRVKKSLFPRVFVAGRSYFTPHLTLRVATNNDNVGRVSFVVSKSITKSAVKRNSLRRHGYSVVSSLKKDIKTGCIYVFFYKKGAENVTLSDLSREIKEVMGKILLI